MALTMSVPRSMQRIVTVPRGRGMPRTMKSRKGVISGMLLVRVYAIDFFRLSKMRRPGEDGQPFVKNIKKTHLPQTSSWTERPLQSSATLHERVWRTYTWAIPVLFLNCDY